eukprot:scaffold107040_cov20-Tisochrysis_lutea.AAC.1
MVLGFCPTGAACGFIQARGKKLEGKYELINVKETSLFATGNCRDLGSPAEGSLVVGAKAPFSKDMQCKVWEHCL